MTEEKKPLTLEGLDKSFSMAWIELFRQKRELESLIDDKFAEQNDLIKVLIKKEEETRDLVKLVIERLDAYEK